jgi:hypothetical protein
MRYAKSTRLLLGLLCFGLQVSAAEKPSDDQAYLDALQGSWTVHGAVGKQPVTYSGRGQRVLNGEFLELHLLDTAQPPQYEADVFIGYDPKANDYIVHWLDRFGAGGARVVASGHREGDRLVVTFPYAEGDFRDTFTHDAVNGSWTLLLESKQKSGSWSTFANFALQKVIAR